LENLVVFIASLIDDGCVMYQHEVLMDGYVPIMLDFDEDALPYF
jgi:hypothetical protein